MFMEVPWGGASNDSGLSTTAIFSVFAGYFFGNLRQEASVIIAYSDTQFYLVTGNK